MKVVRKLVFVVLIVPTLMLAIPAAFIAWLFFDVDDYDIVGKLFDACGVPQT